MQKNGKELQHAMLQTKLAVFEKRNSYVNAIQAGRYGLQLIELNYNNACNFSCKHCFSMKLASKEPFIGIQDVERLAAQADELGVWQFNLQGGEPLIWKDLDDVIRAINPERFHVTLTTNGYLLTVEKARHLKLLGVDKISVSLDSSKASVHDENRNKVESYSKAIEALHNAKQAGLHANVNYVVTRDSVRSRCTYEMINFAEKNGYSLLVIVATASGNWAGCYNKLITADDARYLRKLKEKHPVLNRDLYPAYGINYGCRTMNGLVYITPSGDLLGCPFIHIRIGNILREPLVEILRRGWRVKHFHDHRDICLAGEDLNFIEKYMAKTWNTEIPIDFHDAFNEEDLYPESE